MARLPFADDEAERRRVALVRRLGLLDSAPEERFDVFTRLAARITGMPVALLSLVDERRVWFKSAFGLPPGMAEVPRDAGACGLVAALGLEEEAVVIPDARQDPRLATRDLVTGPFGLRFYAGVPVRAPGGEVLAALCVLDRAPHPEPPGLVEGLRDLAAGVATAFRLHEVTDEALRDPLTGLGSRRLLEEALGREAPGRALALLDLDRFRQINEALGHAAGDEVLRLAGAALAAAAPRPAIAARLGADEFAVLGPLAPGEDAAAFGARMRRAIRGVRLPNTPWMRLEAAVGVAAGAGPLMPAADAALYRARRAGGGGVALAGAAAAGGIGSKVALSAALRAALDDPAQLGFVLQPIAPLDDPGRPTGFELLARWRHPALGDVPPDEFIPVAERMGLSLALDHRALRAAADMMARLPPHVLRLSVNVTPSFLAMPGAMERLDAAVAGAPGFDPARLCLELTERVLVQDPALLREVAGRLLARGIGLALDDFGDGQAALGMLAEIPFTSVKLTARLVAPLATPGPAAERAAAIVEAVCAVGARLGFRTVAEGVETEDQARRLRDLGCREAQGWWIGRPAPPAAWAIHG
ncbi:EAL domain-containing protein [Roseococcus sp. DSY-14]|uniref:EAL domain-containing protein n=1 Tax=Roseococcus sp. DSY-14 TaxID=3369650 RepID=UPI00387B6968